MTRPTLEPARLLIRLGRWSEAERRLREALLVAPHDYDALCLLTLVLWKQDKDDEALAVADTAVEAEVGEEWAHRLRGLVLLSLGRPDEAKAATAHAVTLAPDEAVTHRTYAMVLHRIGSTAEALPAARHAVALDPHDADNHAQLADIASDAYRPTEARAAYLAALRLDPEHTEARHDLAVLDLTHGHLFRAMRGLIAAAAARPATEGETVQHNLTMVLHRIGYAVGILTAVGYLTIGVTWTGAAGGWVGTPARVACGLVAALLGVLTAVAAAGWPQQARLPTRRLIANRPALAVALSCHLVTIAALTGTAVTGHVLPFLVAVTASAVAFGIGLTTTLRRIIRS
jgi:Flp pilus assembly protein TadD